MLVGIGVSRLDGVQTLVVERSLALKLVAGREVHTYTPVHKHFATDTHEGRTSLFRSSEIQLNWKIFTPVTRVFPMSSSTMKHRALCSTRPVYILYVAEHTIPHPSGLTEDEVAGLESRLSDSLRHLP